MAGGGRSGPAGVGRAPADPSAAEPRALVRLLALQERRQVLADQRPVPLRVPQRLDRPLLRRAQRVLRGGRVAAR